MKLIIIVLIELKLVLSIDDVTKDLLTPLQEIGEACGYMSCPKIEEDVINVHIVPHTHGELGYTHTFYEHYTGYDEVYDHSNINMKNILDATITELWANEHRKFTFSDFPYFFLWWKNRDETVRRMVFQLLRQGRLYFVGGGWGMPDEATTNYHAIIDLFTYGLRKLNATFLECGRPLVSWQADAFGHSREVASLMAQMGYDGHFINPISFDDELERMRTRSMEFVWRGSDDLGINSDIYTHKLFDGYWSPPGFCFGGLCTDPLIITNSQFVNVEERVDEFIRAVKKRQGPYYMTNHVMVIMGRRNGYYDAKTWFANIEKLIIHVNERQHMVKDKMTLYYSTPACYLRAVHNNSPKLANKQDDFFPLAYNKDTHFSGMFTSRPVVKQQARDIHRYVQMAKQLQVLASLGNNDQKFEDMMWTAGVLQDHNIITGAMRPHVVTYYYAKFSLAKRAALDIYQQAFNKLRKTPSSTPYHICRFNVSSCWTLEGNWSYLVIYNPLAWPVSIPVRLPMKKKQYVVYDNKGNILDAVMMQLPWPVIALPERHTTVKNDLVFIAENIPPLGYRAYYIEVISRNNRLKRSIIKKLKKTKKKKYITHQTNNVKINDNNKLLLNNDMLEPEYEYFDDTTTVTSKTKIVFGDVSRRKDNDYDNDYILTPRAKYVDATVTEMSPLDDSSTVTSVFPENVTELLTTPRVSGWMPLRGKQSEPEALPELDDEVEPATHSIPYTTPTISTTTHVNYQSYHRRMSDNIYFSEESNVNFIKNKYVRLNLDSNRQISSLVLSNGVNISLNVKFFYYVADDPQNLGTGKRAPGAYIFRPIDNQPIYINSYMTTIVYKTSIVEEVHFNYSDFASFAVRIYKDMPTIELDWLVGPIPDDDGYGKDVFIRYETDLNNDGAFFTDCNGRQTIKRIRDARATYVPVNDDRIPGNIFPVTSKIYIEDKAKNIRLSIFTDRAQGGTSLTDGQIDLMLHRRLFTDDSGVQTFMNETFNGKGLIVRGKHYLYLTKANFKPNRVFEKKFAKELELGPFVFASTHAEKLTQDFKGWFDYNNEFVGVNVKLPVGVHVLTLEKWGDKLLLRLENYLEKSDVVKNGVKKVFIKNMFKTFNLTDARETYLAGNIWLDEMRTLKWRTEKFYRNFNDAYGTANGEYGDDDTETREAVDLNNGIVLKPQEIRTFVVSYVNNC